MRRREEEQDGLPPARRRLSSPYDLDARWAAKGDDLFWLGYKIHLSETCGKEDNENPVPNQITNVATSDATVPDAVMTEPIHQALAGRQLTPGEHYVNSGYPSAALVASSLTDFGTVLISPLLADCSPQARAGEGYQRAAFTVDFDQQVRDLPAGPHELLLEPLRPARHRRRGHQALSVKVGQVRHTG